MSESLLISAIGEDRPGIVKQISRFILDRNGNITDSRMAVLGGEFAIILLVEGDVQSIAKVEKDINEQSLAGLLIQTKRTKPMEKQSTRYYSLRVVSMDHPGIVHDVTEFLSGYGANIVNLETATYAAALTGTTMFSLELLLEFPINCDFTKFEKALNDTSERLNIDMELNIEE